MHPMDPSAVVAPPHIGRPFRLLPFRGITLRAQQVGDAATVATLARAYRDRASRLQQWERSGRLSHETAPAVYVQEYSAGGLVVRGLVGALDLSRRAASVEDRAVLPHEGVHQPQVRHLARRMSRTGLNPAPILLVHHGPPRARDLLAQIVDRPPTRSFDDARGGHHRFWAIQDAEARGELDRELSDATPVIADGHHRYAAALRLQSKEPDSAWHHSLAMLVDQDETPLFLGAIHRVWSGLRVSDLEEAATPESGFRLERMPRGEALDHLGPDAAVLTDGRCWARLTWDSRVGEVLVEDLQARLLPRLSRPPRDVSYHHSVDEALTRTRGRRAVAVLLPALDFDRVREVVAANRLLPEKATSFQPKPPLGVLMRSAHDE